MLGAGCIATTTTTTSSSSSSRRGGWPIGLSERRRRGAALSTPRLCRQRPRDVAAESGKMYVPSDGFGGVSPERKAAQALTALFTFVAAKVVLAQLEGSGRGGLAAYDRESWQALDEHLRGAAMGDGHEWLAGLLKRHKPVALRVLECRAAYAERDFEFDQLQRLATEGVRKSNLQLMRAAAAASLSATVAAAAGAAEEVAAAEAAEESATVAAAEAAAEAGREEGKEGAAADGAGAAGEARQPQERGGGGGGGGDDAGRCGGTGEEQA